MFTKTSIALAIIVAICSSSAVVAQTRQDGAKNDFRGPGLVLINRCGHGNWDAYGARCLGVD